MAYKNEKHNEYFASFEKGTTLYGLRKSTEMQALPSVKRAVALGVFDGIHLGHRAVIFNTTAVKSENEWLKSCVLSFSNPINQLPKNVDFEISTEQQNLKQLSTLGVQEWVKLDFNIIRNMTPEQFVFDFLYTGLNVRRICCGENYRFGKGAVGDTDMLKKLCKKYDTELVVTKPVQLDGNGAVVSSTEIRNFIVSGEFGKAARMLGRPFSVETAVTHGKKIGHLLGTPTINQPLPNNFITPKFGVYASVVDVGEKTEIGVTNIGVKPTVGSDAPLAETWILDFDGDLYGREIPVYPVKFLRGEVKFDDTEQLKKNILNDAENAKKVFDFSGKAVIFDFDDTLQHRGVALEKFIHYFMNRHFGEMSHNEREKRKKQMIEMNGDGYLDYYLFFENLIKLWAWENAPNVSLLVAEMQLIFPTFTKLFENVIELLITLRKSGYKLGIITNGTSLMQNRKLDCSGLRKFFDIVTVCGDENIQKPNSEVFIRTALKMGVSPKNCVYIGDNFVNDVVGSASAGMTPLFFNFHSVDMKGKNVHVVESLAQIPDAVSKIFS